MSADGAAWTSAVTIDKSNGRIGLGTSAPTAPLTASANAAALPSPPSGTLVHFAAADATITRLVLNAFGAPALFNFRRADGTAASPSALQSGDSMGGFNWFGYGASASTSLLELSALATENWTNSAQGCALRVFTTPNGSTSKAERVRFSEAGFVGIGVDSAGLQTRCRWARASEELYCGGSSGRERRWVRSST